MSRVQPIRDLGPVLESFLERQRAFSQPLRQGLSLDVLHDEVVHAVLLAYIMERANMQVVELGDGLGLALEACLALGAIGEQLGKDLTATVLSRRVSLAL